MSPTRHPDHWLANKKITISGAGISGLSFAIALHKLWPSTSSTSPPPQITLYERDPSPAPAGREGYSLSLRSDSPSAGIQTLQKLGLLEKLLEVSITGLGEGDEEKGEEGGFVIWNREWQQVLKVRSKTPKGLPVAGMRINRAALRRTLVEAVEGLPNARIVWDLSVVGVHAPSFPSSAAELEVELKSGESKECDILIAADGSSSKLRTLLRPDDGLRFAGPACIFGTAPIASHPSLAETRTREFGSVISGRGVALFVAPIDEECLVWSLSWHEDQPPVPKKQPLSPKEVDEILGDARARGGPVFGDRFLRIVSSTKTDSIARFNAQDKLSFPHSGSYITSPSHTSLSGKIVFLGDANHAVSPFAGNGANLAIMDGWDFAESLVASGDMAEALEMYDKVAVGRARQVVKMSHFSIAVMHARGWRLWVYMVFLRVVKWLFFL